MDMKFSDQQLDEFKNMSLSPKLLFANSKIALSTPDQLIRFVQEGTEFWQRMNQNQGVSGSSISGYRDYYIQIDQRFQALVNSSESSFTDALRYLNEYIVNASPQPYIKSKLAKFIERKASVELNSEYFTGVYLFIISSEVPTIFHRFRGFNDALCFMSNSQSKENFQILSDQQQGVIDEGHRLMSYSSDVLDHCKKLNAELLSSAQSKFDELHREKLEALQLMEKRLEEKEEFFNVQLALQSPVAYWNKLAQDYRMSFIYWVGPTSAIALAFFFVMYSRFNQLDVVGLAPSLIVQKYISLFLIGTVAIYIVKTGYKIALSSLHMSRDARERSNLAQVYLAFIKEQGKANETEVSIVYQSLFSRTDTGLLKGDSSPAIPDSALQQLLKAVKA